MIWWYCFCFFYCFFLVVPRKEFEEIGEGGKKRVFYTRLCDTFQVEEGGGARGFISMWGDFQTRKRLLIRATPFLICFSGMCSCLAASCQEWTNARRRRVEGGEMSNLNAKVKQKQTDEICHTCVSASQFRVSDLNLFFFFEHKLSFCFLQNAAACSFFYLGKWEWKGRTGVCCRFS